MVTTGKKQVLRIASLTLAIAVSIPMASFTGTKGTLRAADKEGKNTENTHLGTSGISSPKLPESDTAPWKGDYLWYGNYNNSPVKYRVLAPETSDFGGDTMLLDSDLVLFDMKFSEKYNAWSNSSLRTYLNGTFYQESFSELEKGAIVKSSGSGAASSMATYVGKTFSKVDTDDKVFLLDAYEETKHSYGFYPSAGAFAPFGTTEWEFYGISSCAKKDKAGKDHAFWMRSPVTDNSRMAGIVASDGHLFTESCAATSGVAPALNLDRESILFNTEVKAHDENGVNAEFKLTLIDTDLGIAVTSGKEPLFDQKDNSLTIPYSVNGNHAANADLVSVLILDKPYTAGNQNDAQILYYGALEGDFKRTGEGKIILPESLDFSSWGTNFYVYILAEDTATGNSAIHASDYASAPVLVSKPRAKVIFDVSKGSIRSDAFHGSVLKALQTAGLLTLTSDSEYYYVDVDKDGNIDLNYHFRSRISLEKAISCNLSGIYEITSAQLSGTAYSSVVFIFSIQKPGMVRNLKAASAGKNRVTLTWNPVEGVEGYLVYAQKKGQYGYVGMTTKGTTFTDTKALDTEYNFYWVFGYTRDYYNNMVPGGCEKYVYAKGVCLAVTDLKASSVTGGVKLTWTASAGAEGYLVYGIHPGGSYGYIGMTTQGTTFTDKKASKTDWNFYWVFPYHKNGDTMVVGGTPKYVYGRAK
ncbi:MAG: hypothetical protein IKZ90_09700 [Clostridiales bacterium]|nr:hypothetical protein [Clostridiales bacterium]